MSFGLHHFFQVENVFRGTLFLNFLNKFEKSTHHAWFMTRTNKFWMRTMVDFSDRWINRTDDLYGDAHKQACR